MKYFNKVKSYKELKETYRELLKKNHPDTATLSAFGLPYEVGYQYENNDYSKGLDYLFDALKFSDIQRKAYRDARSYVLSHSNF